MLTNVKYCNTIISNKGIQKWQNSRKAVTQSHGTKPKGMSAGCHVIGTCMICFARRYLPFDCIGWFFLKELYWLRSCGWNIW